jgi:ketosteroid isomerase-like protein
MPTAEDVAVVHRLYAAVAAGDRSTVAECFDEEAI